MQNILFYSAGYFFIKKKEEYFRFDTLMSQYLKY